MRDVDTHKTHVVVDKEMETGDKQESSFSTKPAANQSSITTTINTEHISTITATSRFEDKKQTRQDMEEDEELDDSEDKSSQSSFALSVARGDDTRPIAEEIVTRSSTRLLSCKKKIRDNQNSYDSSLEKNSQLGVGAQ